MFSHEGELWQSKKKFKRKNKNLFWLEFRAYIFKEFLSEEIIIYLPHVLHKIKMSLKNPNFINSTCEQRERNKKCVCNIKWKFIKQCLARKHSNVPKLEKKNIWKNNKIREIIIILESGKEEKRIKQRV